MRILLIHSYYRQKGGEDVVFEQEFELLKKSQDVIAITFRNFSAWHGAAQFLGSIWNIRAARKIKKEIREFRPHVVQIYNWHYGTGPIIIRTANKLGAKVIMNTGNYRLLCPSGTLTHKGKLFTESITKKGFPWKAVVKKVYRESYFQTFWLAFVVWFHTKLKTWQKVDRYIVPSRTVRELFANAQNNLNLPVEKFVVKPNFSVQSEILKRHRNNHFLYIGRLSEEKGIGVLLEAFKNSPHQLVIAGSGPLLNDVTKISSIQTNIKFAGPLDKEAVKEALSNCNALIFPSICYETFGMVITEAMSNGCPIIASDIGSPSEIVLEGITGIHFRAGDKESLRSALDCWQSLSHIEKEQYQKNCFSKYEEFYTPEKNSELLMEIYNSVVEN